MRRELFRIELLLRKHGFDGQADVVADLLTRYDAPDQTEFRRRVQDVEMWGGSGSVIDCAIVANPRHVTPDLQQDERAFRSAIVQLADEMDRAGLGTPRSRDVAATFRARIERGI
jgi:hypothetical protein